MRLPVLFLLADATGTGGLARTVIGTANRVAVHREARLVSVVQRAPRARYPAEVPHHVLDRGDGLGRRLLRRRPSRLVPDDGLLSAATDQALRRWLSALPPSILVTTRPSLHLAATTWAPPHVRLVGWDHLNFPSRWATPWVARTLDTAVPDLDAWVVLTRADADDYVDRLHPGKVAVIRNALPWPPAERPAPLDGKVIVAAGRLVKAKGFGRLVEAFAPVAAKHPDWQLQIHGDGDRRAALQRRVDRLGLREQVRLPGYTTRIRQVLHGASAYAMTSRAEGFPMVLLEAMAEGLPLVSMDCPRGPGEIIEPGSNGLLVADGDVDGFTRALLEVVEDDARRRRLGHQAWRDAECYREEIVTGEWLDLLDEVGG